MRKVLLTLVALAISITSAHASGFALYEASVRISGMMGAYVANGNHVSTIFFNPAGLAQLSGTHVHAGGVMIAPRTSFRGPFPSVEKTDMETQEFIVPNIYVSHQIMDDLTLGLGVYAPFGLGSKWDQDWVGNSYSTETRIQTAVANPVVAYKLPDFGAGDIMIGAGLQVGFLGNATLERAITDFANRDGMIRLEGETDGLYYGYNFGIIYRPISKLSFGFSYKSQLELEFSGDAEFTDLPESVFPETTGGLTITTPAHWAAGISAEPVEHLTVNFDYVWWGWSSYDELFIDFENETAVLQDLRSIRDYEDVFQLRLGMEYGLPQVSNMMIRGGIGFDKNPIPDYTIDPTLPDTDRLLFSGGLTYAFNDNFAVDMYYTFIRGEQREVDEPRNPLKGIYNTYANIFGLAFSMTL
jgi:long-chain fatty acid transport protein